ncbi:DUF3060 domain-containing protein [Mycobacterium sp. 852002-51057_SCH5723018]|uniref:DUF3060 domain-containing protein n=1 Tax=Mycobacterium sp. 852002-51057_SCH5723018 TaxID=1834094 RepID=UPI0007FE0286|nr:DUF3060 domain-containing protein [Mycobacterium sp. 852002-51057_SCH5723018]OBG30360.1 hypothetical protein A5764_02110 [Mycobacterium sp. 852002-51057_SCH5723018]
MDSQDDPEERIRELERPLADTARASELGAPQQPPGGYAYPPGPAGPPPPPPSPWTYGGPLSGPPPKPRSGNRAWWILGTFIVVGLLALAGGIAAFAAHQLSGVRSVINSPPTISGTFGPSSSTPSRPVPSTTRSKTPKPSTSPTAPPGGNVSVSGVNENRTIACNDNIVSVSGVSNTVVITGHCTSLTVSGVQNSITVDSVDTIDASGFNNKITYHTGAPKITNAGGSNQVQQG